MCRCRLTSVLDKVGDERVGSEVQRGLLGQVAIGSQTREQMDAEVDWAAVTRVLDLADVLELVEDGLDERTFAQQEPVGEVEELIAHVLAQFGDEPQPVAQEQSLSQRSRDIARVAKETSEEALRETWYRTTVVGVT